MALPKINTTPPMQDWDVYAGDANEQAFEFLTADGGGPLDITGATILAQAREKRTDVGPPALEAVCTVTDGPNGLAVVGWDGDEVRLLLGLSEEWSGEWDMQVLRAGATLPVSVRQGKMRAYLDVARPVAP